MKYLVAVSGGIDSVVLLDMMARSGKYELIVAHFDHGIREDSAADARFVEGLARKYHLPFVTRREVLGEQASEELARTKRYDFLRSEAKKRHATIVTAHHQDDVVESIVINMIRGTGWRGLAVLSAPDIRRPLLHFSKAEIRTYALDNRLEWVEDSTNAETKYLRNRLRRRIKTRLIPEQEEVVIARWKRQVEIKDLIDKEMAKHQSHSGEYPRYLLIMIDPTVAAEMLRGIIAAQTGWPPTRPQAERALLAVKTARPGTNFEVGAKVNLRFTTRTFIVETS